MNRDELLDKLAKTIIDGDEQAASVVANEILSAGINPLEAIKQGATKGLDEIGERYQRLEAFLPELIRGGEAMKACMAVFMPHIKPEQESGLKLGRVVIGTVVGDIHDIGKSVVATMLTVTGFEVYDLGTDVPIKQFIEKAREVEARVIAFSALLTQSCYYQHEAIKYLRDAGLRGKYYVVIGGAPVTPEWAAEIGADGYGRSAVHASQLLKKLVTEGMPPPLPQPIIIQ
ncbi:MAG: corrinoid protein [Candidatus Binatia bacterium]